MTVSAVTHNKNSSNKLNFARALTTRENKVLTDILQRGREEAGIDTFAIGLPIAAAPAVKDKQDTGIGSFEGVKAFMQKAKGLMGVNTVLFLPIGSSYDNAHSPFSTGAFGIYEGYFIPEKLTGENYGKLLNPENDLDKKVLDALANSANPFSGKTQYENIDKVEAVLNRAYENYTNGADKLKKEFESFQQRPEINYWLDAYAKNKDPENPERFKFKQFIAEKQYNQMKQELNSNGVDVIVDVPVGADRQLDAKIETDKGNPDPFIDSPIEAFDGNQDKWVDWGLNPLDPGLDSGKELAYWKAHYHGKHGDGARLDSFQNNMFASNRNGVMWQYNNNPEVIADQLFYGLKDGGVDPEKSFAEHLPGSANYDIGKVDAHLEGKSNHIFGSPIGKLTVKKWNDFGPNSFYSYGSHEISGYHQDRNGDKEGIKNGFAELLSGQAKKAFLPFTDIFGIDRTYNISNTSNDTNWTIRLTENWEEEYHKKLQDGFGFNAPEVFGKVLEQKDKGGNQTAKILNKIGNILRQTGAKTQEQANNDLGKEYIDSELNNLLNT